MFAAILAAFLQAMRRTPNDDARHTLGLDALAQPERRIYCADGWITAYVLRCR